MERFNIKINGKDCDAVEGENILEVAHRNNIIIPALCYNCDIIAHESCRLCMVEVEGEKGLRASCSYKVRPGLSVRTDTIEIANLLRINLELLFAQHAGKCDSCIKKNDCKLRYLAYELANVDQYTNRKAGKRKYQFGPSILFDPEKCINCENCSEICSRQTNGGFIRPREGKYNFEVCPSKDNSLDCIYCGQCIAHCPVGALSEVEDYQKVISLLKNKSKKVVFQFAPAIRVALGEEFGMKTGEIVTNKIFSALDKIGAYASFDTSFAADVTIMEEGAELLERIHRKKKGAMFSSCCPAWVKYLEFYEPSFIKNLTKVRSPQIIQGGLIKNYWAESNDLNPDEIMVVSIMPCTAKKYEITRSELKVHGRKPVDFVITTREFAKLLRSFGVDLKQIEDKEPSGLMSNISGAAEIFGASGGVLEAALRTVLAKISGRELKDIEFETLHKSDGIKIIEAAVAGNKLKAVAVSGINNVKLILDELKTNPNAYDYVEVMACPGGCISGGGQPLPVDKSVREMRSKAIYNSDRSQKNRVSHHNADVKKLYEDYFKFEENREKICHTKYSKKNKDHKTYKLK